MTFYEPRGIIEDIKNLKGNLDNLPIYCTVVSFFEFIIYKWPTFLCSLITGSHIVVSFCMHDNLYEIG